MTKIYCRDVGCKYLDAENDEYVCTRKEIDLSWISTMTTQGRKTFHNCLSYEDSDFTKDCKEFLKNVMKEEKGGK